MNPSTNLVRIRNRGTDHRFGPINPAGYLCYPAEPSDSFSPCASVNLAAIAACSRS